jgi:hypothetical protein
VFVCVWLCVCVSSLLISSKMIQGACLAHIIMVVSRRLPRKSVCTSHTRLKNLSGDSEVTGTAWSLPRSPVFVFFLLSVYWFVFPLGFHFSVYGVNLRMGCRQSSKPTKSMCRSRFKNTTTDLKIGVIPKPPLWMIGSVKRFRIHVCQVGVRLRCEG